jgi:hypothetical protein
VPAEFFLLVYENVVLGLGVIFFEEGGIHEPLSEVIDIDIHHARSAGDFVAPLLNCCV